MGHTTLSTVNAGLLDSERMVAMVDRQGVSLMVFYTETIRLVT